MMRMSSQMLHLLRLLPAPRLRRPNRAERHRHRRDIRLHHRVSKRWPNRLLILWLLRAGRHRHRGDIRLRHRWTKRWPNHRLQQPNCRHGWVLLLRQGSIFLQDINWKPNDIAEMRFFRICCHMTCLPDCASRCVNLCSLFRMIDISRGFAFCAFVFCIKRIRGFAFCITCLSGC